MNLICSSSHWTQHCTKMQPVAVQSPSGSIGNLNRTRFYSVGVTHLTNIGICCPPPNPPPNGRSRPSITQTNEGSRPRRWKTTKQNKNRPPPTPSPLQNLWKQISNIRYTKCVRVYVCTLQRTKVKEYQMDCWPSCHTYTYTHTQSLAMCVWLAAVKKRPLRECCERQDEKEREKKGQSWSTWLYGGRHAAQQQPMVPLLCIHSVIVSLASSSPFRSYFFLGFPVLYPPQRALTTTT